MQHTVRAEPAQRRPMEMVEMGMRDDRDSGCGAPVRYRLARRFIQPPAAPVDRADQPGVGGDDRFAVLQNEQAGMTDGAQLQDGASMN